MAITTDEVWRHVEKKTFAVVSWSTPAGEPRSSGVMYRAVERRLYLGVDATGWKAKHAAASGRMSVTVLVRRGGLLSLLAPIPPATVSFRGGATVHPSTAFSSLPKEIEKLLMPGMPLEEQAVIEIRPEGDFVTYGIGVSLLGMRKPELASGRVPVG
jgi:hypothetical protein